MTQQVTSLMPMKACSLRRQQDRQPPGQLALLLASTDDASRMHAPPGAPHQSLDDD
jgi:hypothetical protein